LQNYRITRREGLKDFALRLKDFALRLKDFALPFLQSCNPAILQFRDSVMQIARVVGTLVATQKHRKFEGAKLLLVQPLDVDDRPRGAALLAIDSVGAGVHEKVLIVLEGRAAGEALGRKAAPVDAAIVGIIDQVDIDGRL
jgi:microcompartment protein CcmK/EutM